MVTSTLKVVQNRAVGNITVVELEPKKVVLSFSGFACCFIWTFEKSVLRKLFRPEVGEATVWREKLGNEEFSLFVPVHKQFFLAQHPPIGQGVLIHLVSSSHQRRTTVSRTPLDK
jgi:hypothetical protein